MLMHQTKVVKHNTGSILLAENVFSNCLFISTTMLAQNAVFLASYL